MLILPALESALLSHFQHQESLPNGNINVKDSSGSERSTGSKQTFLLVLVSEIRNCTIFTNFHNGMFRLEGTLGSVYRCGFQNQLSVRSSED